LGVCGGLAVACWTAK